MTLSPDDRILILAPHPDDETLACAGILQKAVAAGTHVRVAFLTNGDYNELSFFMYRKRPILLGNQAIGMGVVRAGEAVLACAILGVPKEAITFLGYPDGGTGNMWTSHWGNAKPYRGGLTHARSVPYRGALSFGAAYRSENLLSDISKLIAGFRPTKIFVSHPADRNADHRALYLFTKVALWSLPPDLRPEVYPYLMHFEKWPQKKGFYPLLPLDPPGELADGIPWEVAQLSLAQERTKEIALRAHRTQMNYSREFMLSFVRTDELFGQPRDITIDGTGRPNAGGSNAGKGRANGSPSEPSFAAYSGQFARLDGATLTLSAELSRGTAREVDASVYIFGWRADKEFSAMPKIRVKIGPFGYSVYDQQFKLPDNTAFVTRASGKVTVSVPLDALGYPERVITNAGTYGSEALFDDARWTAIILGGGPADLRSTAVGSESTAVAP